MRLFILVICFIFLFTASSEAKAGPIRNFIANRKLKKQACQPSVQSKQFVPQPVVAAPQPTIAVPQQMQKCVDGKCNLKSK